MQRNELRTCSFYRFMRLLIWLLLQNVVNLLLTLFHLVQGLLSFLQFSFSLVNNGFIIVKGKLVLFKTRILGTLTKLFEIVSNENWVELNLEFLALVLLFLFWFWLADHCDVVTVVVVLHVLNLGQYFLKQLKIIQKTSSCSCLTLLD